ncbi:DUF1648 domain-containing protein [Corynebacterium sp. NPDC060344]|uniref:DUF1648 domain-containing protein n=1 Tax=Corynebacterium sp. NPDC060344 TaxID=3347101 RepID=UPI003663D383
MFMELVSYLLCWTEDPGGSSPAGRSAGSCPKHVQPSRRTPLPRLGAMNPRSTGLVCHEPQVGAKSPLVGGESGLRSGIVRGMDRLTTDRGGASNGRWDAVALLGFVVAPIAGLVGVVAWALSVKDGLPDPIATHFGIRGEADGVGSLTGILVILVLVTVPLIALMGGMGSWRKYPRIMRRSLGPGSTAFSGFMIGLVPETLVPQLDRASANGVTIGWAWTVAGLGIGLVVGIVTAMMLPADKDHAAPSAPDPSLPRGPRANPVRTGTSTGMKVAVAAYLVASLAMLIVSVGGFLLILLSAFYLLQTMFVRVRVDDDAVRFRAIIGESIPLETITAARPSTYDWGDSGGVGIRGVEYRGSRGKRVAVASRSGEALDIDTTGTNWTIVVPDGTAEALAGDINSRLDRLHG